MHSRPVPAALAAAAIALGLALGLAASPAGARPGNRPVCRAAQLHGRLAGSSGAAGTIVLSLRLTNVGTACTLDGDAGLILMHGVSPLTTRVLHGGLAVLGQAPRPVVLGHGGKATVFVAYSDVPSGSERRCPRSDALLVRPPGQVNWLRVAAPATACSAGTLRESPVLSGARPAP